ncbi:hypothetical protein LRU_00034 [Ligilactobacillus ruminis SPM0211]|uniref:Uncharacterized protein n=2 Tax=Ligilactobacillus ruminis TaxID=1623 RepID=F7QX80_9LACO|nr:hypothetical protein HMPREF0542_10483 [Ligilactobacillus ruminis ATCC 25644]EGM53641.1 hypothetical protein LRU_00034 [Ligilactobacillus ruminis SPM0211]
MFYKVYGNLLKFKTATCFYILEDVETCLFSTLFLFETFFDIT